MQSLDSIETYAYETRKDLVSDKEKTKCNKTIQKMIDFDDVPYRILIIGGSGSGKVNSLFIS